MSRQRTRRRFLTGITATLGALGLAALTGADDHRSFVLEQDGDCRPVVPLSGELPVENFYRWGKVELSWGSTGTRELQRPETSLLFLYRGPRGLSLVFVHDALDDGTPGGKASVSISGVPEEASWVVKDDLYEASTNVDQWEINGTVLEANDSTVTDDYPPFEPNSTRFDGNDTDNTTTLDGNVTGDPERFGDENATEFDGNGTDNSSAFDGNATEFDGNATDGNETAYDARTDEIDWWWTAGRTDGGALRGLAVDGLELRIEPAFNEDAALAEKENEGEITRWTLLSGDLNDPERTELDLEEPVTLRTGACDADEPATTETGRRTENASRSTARETEPGTERDTEATPTAE